MIEEIDMINSAGTRITVPKQDRKRWEKAGWKVVEKPSAPDKKKES